MTDFAAPARLHSPIADTQRRVRAEPPETVDVAIVGCGPGGLYAGARLARAGLRVACFDHHYVAGGCATMFERGKGDKWRFDVGLHYIGDCGADGQIPRLLAGAGVLDVTYAPLDPDGFDTLVFPDFRFRIPVGLDRYRDRLAALFPREIKGIDRYCRFLREVWQTSQRMDARGGRTNLLLLVDVLLRGRMLARYQRATIGALLDDCSRDPALRAVLLGQSGDYGVPPSRASALLHAGLAMHYFAGAWYPRGGGQVIADALARTIEQAGGQVCLRRGIAAIDVRDGRAVGVTTEAAGRRPGQAVRARAVVSNADIRKTMLELLPPAALPAEWRARATGWQMGGALWLTCLGLRGTPAEIGLAASNYWQFDGYDVEEFYRAAATDGRPTPRGAYITSGTAKDPDTAGHAPEGHSTVEIMALVPADPALWGCSAAAAASGDYRTSAAYLERKQALEADLVARLDRMFPGAAARVVLRESASPLTHSRYTRATDGTGYGLAATPDQFLDRRPGYRGPLPGLYLAGASTRAGHGIVGALTSGLRCAERVAADLGVKLAP